MANSVNFLKAKHMKVRAEEKVPDHWRGIKISERVLAQSSPSPPHHIREAVGVVSGNIKAVMNLHPKTAKYTQLQIYKTVTHFTHSKSQECLEFATPNPALED